MYVKYKLNVTSAIYKTQLNERVNTFFFKQLIKIPNTCTNFVRQLHNLKYL